MAPSQACTVALHFQVLLVRNLLMCLCFGDSQVTLKKPGG